MVTISSHIVFLAIVNLFVFLIPVDSGERVFLCHHCVAFFYRVFVNSHDRYFKIQCNSFVIFRIHVDDSSVKIRSQFFSKMVVWGVKNQSKPQNSVTAVTSDKISQGEHLDVD